MKNLTKRYYQWIPMSSDRNDIVYLVEIFKDDDITFYKFNDDSICAESLILPYNSTASATKNAAMVELVDYQHSWKFEKPQQLKTGNFADVGRENNDNTSFDIPMIDESYNIVPPILNGEYIRPINVNDYIKQEVVETPDVIYTTEELVIENEICEPSSNIQHTKQSIYMGVYDETDDASTTSFVKNDNINNKNDVDPIGMLIEKANKTASIISMDLSVNLPSKSLFNVINENFDDGADRFIELILDEIDYKIIKESLKDALLNAYKMETNVAN